MTYRLSGHPKVEDDIASLPDTYQIRIRKAIRALSDDPRPHGAKKLIGIKPGINNVYRLRVGIYRVGYQVFDGELLIAVIAAAERGGIYPLLKRRLKK